MQRFGYGWIYPHFNPGETNRIEDKEEATNIPKENGEKNPSSAGLGETRLAWVPIAGAGRIRFIAGGGGG